jgi:hypothetical protein
LNVLEKQTSVIADCLRETISTLNRNLTKTHDESHEGYETDKVNGCESTFCSSPQSKTHERLSSRSICDVIFPEEEGTDEENANDE